MSNAPQSVLGANPTYPHACQGAGGSHATAPSGTSTATAARPTARILRSIFPSVDRLRRNVRAFRLECAFLCKWSERVVRTSHTTGGYLGFPVRRWDLCEPHYESGTC